jgi:hypothetical protein
MSTAAPPTTPPKVGGKELLRILAAGGPDVRHSLVPEVGGGLKADLETKHPGVRCDLEYVAMVNGGGLAALEPRLIGEPVDVLILSIGSWIGGDLDVGRFRQTLVDLVRAVKAGSGAHVIVYIGSSVDPADSTVNYHGRPEPTAVRIQRAGLAALEVSVLEGISIVDVDRIMAELGADAHVTDALAYSAEASRAICADVLRILEEIGFFEKRLLVMQIGRRRGRA